MTLREKILKNRFLKIRSIRIQNGFRSHLPRRMFYHKKAEPTVEELHLSSEMRLRLHFAIRGIVTKSYRVSPTNTHAFIVFSSGWSLDVGPTGKPQLYDNNGIGVPFSTGSGSTYPGIDGVTLDLLGAGATIEVAAGGITPTQLGTITDGVTLDQSAAGSKLEVKSNSIGATQVTSAIEKTANKNAASGYAGLSAGSKIAVAQIPVDATTIDGSGAGSTLEIKSASITNALIAAGAAIANSKLALGVNLGTSVFSAYPLVPGTDVNHDTLANLTDVSVGAQTDGQVLAWKASASKWEATSSGSSFPGADGITLDTSGAGGTVEIKNAGVAPAKLGSVTDGVTLDQSGAGSTLEVKAGGIGATQVSSAIEQTANKNAANGYSGLNASSKINAAQIPIDSTLGLVGSSPNQQLHVVSGGSGTPNYGTAMVLVQPPSNARSASQPTVVDNQGFIIVDTNYKVVDSGSQVHSLEYSPDSGVTWYSLTAGFAEATAYIENYWNAINGYTITVAVGTYTIARPWRLPCGPGTHLGSGTTSKQATGYVIEGGGWGDASLQGGTEIQGGSVTVAPNNHTVTWSGASIVTFGNATGAGNDILYRFQGGIIRDIGFSSNGVTLSNNASGIKVVADFFNSNDGGTKSGITWENISVQSDSADYSADFSHNDDGMVKALIQPSGGLGVWASSSSGSMKFHNCRLFGGGATVGLQNCTFLDCVFGQIIVNPSAAPSPNQIIFAGQCYFNSATTIPNVALGSNGIVRITITDGNMGFSGSGGGTTGFFSVGTFTGSFQIVAMNLHFDNASGAAAYVFDKADQTSTMLICIMHVKTNAMLKSVSGSNTNISTGDNYTTAFTLIQNT